MKQPGLRFRSVPPSMVLWLTAAILVSIASCADSSNHDEPCDSGQVACGDTCFDTNNDPENCGACGRVCPGGQVCQEGACGLGEGAGGRGGAGGTGGPGGGCGEEQTDCAGSCVNLETDPTHCGSCEIACASGYACADALCACPAATTECVGACLDLQSDVAHCGACDVQCGFNQLCTAGACVCKEGLTDCEGTCTNLAVNPGHCGSCDTACAPRAFCHEGECSCLFGTYEDLGTPTLPYTVMGTNVGAGSGYDLSCVAAGSTETVYLFTAPEDGSYSFDTAGSGYDTALGLFNPRNCAELGCNDDFGEQQSRVTAILAADQEVLLVVTGFNGATGDFTLTINQATLPICPSGAIDPALPQTVTGNTAALGDAVAPSCGSAGNPDASYTFVAPHDGRYTFDTLGSGYNTVLEVRNGACDGPSLACNDNFGGEQSRVSVTLTAGQTVVAVVDGYAGGPFSLNVSEYVPPPCPAFDLGSTVPQTVTGNTTGLENAIVAPCGSSGGVELGYSFTAPADALYVFNTFGSGFDTVLYARDGTCGGTTLTCNDDSAGGRQSQIRVLLTAGQTIVVVVDGYSSSASGPFTLNVTQILVPPCPAADLGSTVPQTVTGTTAGLVDVLTPSCGGSSSPEATYRFTAPETGIYLFDTFGSGFNTVLHLHDGTCAGPTLTCNNDSGGPQSRVNVDLTAGQTVIVVIDGNVSTSGSYVLNVNQFTGGGTCATPIDLGSTVPQVVTGSTLVQPSSVAPVCSTSSSAPDTVYSFTAPADGTYIFDTFGSSYNTILQAFNGSCTGGSLACNDDAGGPQSRLSVDLVAGQTMLVAVDGAAGATGDYVLSVNQFIGTGTCSTARDLGSTVPQTVSGSTLLQPNSVTPSCGASLASDTVYTFTAPADGTFIFDTFGSTFNTIVQVRDINCAGVSLACNDNWGGNQSRAVAALVAGQTVVVVVDGASSSAGDFILNITRFDGVGTCSTPIDLGSTVPQTVTGNTSLLLNSIIPACAALSTAPDSVFLFRAPSTGNFVVDTFGSAYDTILHVRNGALCTDPPLACNDDAMGSQSRVSLSLMVDQVVTLVVDGYNTAAGNFTLHINPG